MVNEQLLSYIKAHVAKGTPLEVIKDNLMSGGGWDLVDVNEAFQVLKVSPRPIILPKPPQPVPVMPSQPVQTPPTQAFSPAEPVQINNPVSSAPSFVPPITPSQPQTFVSPPQPIEPVKIVTPLPPVVPPVYNPPPVLRPLSPQPKPFGQPQAPKFTMPPVGFNKPTLSSTFAPPPRTSTAIPSATSYTPVIKPKKTKLFLIIGGISLLVVIIIVLIFMFMGFGKPATPQINNQNPFTATTTNNVSPPIQTNQTETSPVSVTSPVASSTPTTPSQTPTPPTTTTQTNTNTTVTPPAPPSGVAISLSVNGTSANLVVKSGSSVTLKWSFSEPENSDLDQCSGSWENDAIALSGTQVIPNITQSTAFTLSCNYNNNGVYSSINKEVDVSIGN